MIIIDIGCGQKKLPGSIGLDFSEMSDADIVIDLNKDNLPFESNSIDYVYSSHCLEHLTLDGFLNIISEIYRVLKEDGQFYLTVPYYSTGLNLANPFHNNQVCFNEHTFRFFSSSPTTAALPEKEYATPSCPQWGLRYSANSESDIELELVYINYTYFKDSVSKEGDIVSARRAKSDIVDCISYVLKPVKPAPSNTHTAPIETGDPSAYLKKQIEYLSNQMELVAKRGIRPEGIDYRLANLEVLPSGLVNLDDCIILPVYEVIELLSNQISLLGEIIEANDNVRVNDVERQNLFTRFTKWITDKK